MRPVIARTLNVLLRGTKYRPVLRLIPPEAVCAEVGVWRGDFSARILGANPRELHLVDPWQFFPRYVDRWYGATEDNSQARMDAIHDSVRRRFESDSRVVIHRAMSHVAASGFEDAKFDFVYIDGNHDYEFVLRDLESYLPKLKPGGILAGDDYVFPKCRNGGPKRAVEEFLAEHPRLVLLFVERNQFAIRKAGSTGPV